MSWPRCAGGWAFTMACRVELATASTNPLPRMLMVLREAITLARDGMHALLELDVRTTSVREWIRDPPGWSVNTPRRNRPARVSVIWLVAPRTGLAMWHSPQPAALKTGPSPSSAVSGPVNSSTAASMLHSSCGIAGDSSDSFANSAWCAQNSARKPLSSPSNPVGASVGRPLCLGDMTGYEHERQRRCPHGSERQDLESFHCHLTPPVEGLEGSWGPWGHCRNVRAHPTEAAGDLFPPS